MRVSFLLVLLLPGSLLAGTNPLPPPQPPGRAEVPLAQPPEGADSFARQLVSVANQVSELYVRPISRADLLTAALTGLYERARLPVPRDLHARLRKAEQEDRPRTPPPPPGWSMPPSADSPLLGTVQRIRAEVGKTPGLQGQQLFLVCCQAMTRVLDPHSLVSSAAEERSRMGLDALCDSVGLEMEERAATGPLRIKTVFPGSPAQRAGLRPGDEIVALNGDKVKGAPPPLVAQLQTYPALLMPGAPTPPQSRPFRATYHRPGSKETRTVTLQRQRFQPEIVLGTCREEDNRWSYWADARAGLAYVRLANLGKGAADELLEVVSSLRRQNMRGLLLDLRWSPGGYLPEATSAAGLFLAAGDVATVKMRDGGATIHRSDGKYQLTDFPLVVLVNGETSGGAELIAAALQDHRRALVAGQRTRGKGSVQQSLPLGYSTWGLRLTTGTLLRPSGKSLHRFPDSKPTDSWGVLPDESLELRISADLANDLKQAWLEQTLRPGTSKERLLLDDPSADPQRQAALQALREQIKRAKASAAGKGPAS